MATSVAHVLDMVGGAEAGIASDLGPRHAVGSAAILDFGGLETKECNSIQHNDYLVILGATKAFESPLL